MADVDDMMVVSGNGTAHDAVHDEFSNYDEEDDSMEIVARIPNYNAESKEENGNVDESCVEQGEESNELDAFKELEVKETDVPAKPKCQNDTGESLDVKKDKKNKKDGNDVKKATSVKSGSVAIEKKVGNSKPAMVQVRAPLSKEDVSVSYGRRMMISMITFLMPLPKLMQHFDANAADDLPLLQGEIRKVLTKGKAAGVLRLVFHDAGTYEMNDDSGGMNGSILYELDRPENKGLKKSLKIVVEAKKMVDEIQPVSMSDMIAVAGAEAVSLCGGPKIPVRLGRLDSMVPDPEGRLPEETFDAIRLKQSFQQKGFSTQELVALSGAHTLGSKGFGNPIIFDNAYYKVLLEKPWLSSAGMTTMVGLPSDRSLIEDDECLRWISKYAEDQDLFFEDFKNAYIKLVNSGAKWSRNS